jgi:hypothetical protein
MKKRGIVIVILVISISCFAFISSADNNGRMTVEANILAYNPNVTMVSIQVPDYLFFGNLTRGQKSDEITVRVNNTGNVDVSVNPQLEDTSEKIFSYTYFRDQKTKTVNGSITDVPFTRIGDFYFNITKSGYNDIYTVLNLTGYPEDIPQDMPNHRANIIFWALEK